MTTANYNPGHLIRCPSCRASITVGKLYEYVNANPQSKREAIEQEIEKWGLTYYDKAYYVENIVICPNCFRISHLSDWLGF